MQRWSPLLFGVLLSSSVFAQEATPITIVPSAAAKSSVDDQIGTRDVIDRIWNTKITLDVSDTPFSKVLQTIAKTSGIDCQIDEWSLEDVGLTTDWPVTTNLKRVAIGSALEVILSEADLDYVVQPERIVIYANHDARANERFVTRYYPVGNWLGEKADEATLAATSTAVQMISPDDWERFGGGGRCEMGQGGLIVSQPVRIHDQIHRLFSAIVAAKELPDNAYTSGAISIHPLAESAETIRQKLRSERLSIDAPNITLSELVAKIEEQIEVEFVIQVNALEEIGLTVDLPLNRNWVNTPIETILDDLSSFDLGWDVRGDYVCVTTLHELEHSPEVRVYPVRDLTASDRPQEADEVPRSMALRGGFCGSVLPSPFHYPRLLQLKNPRDRLIAIFTLEVVPDSWFNLGGAGTAVANHAADCVIVSQRRGVHERIEKLLFDLRQVQGKSIVEEYEAAAAEMVDVAYAVPRRQDGTQIWEKEDLKQLAKLIETRFITSDNADPTCYAQGLSDRLIVRQRRDVQRAIYRLLIDLNFYQDVKPNAGN